MASLSGLNSKQPLYAYVKLTISDNTIEYDGVYNWDDPNSKNLSDPINNMIISFSRKKVGMGTGTDAATFNLTLFDESAIQLEAMLASGSNSKSTKSSSVTSVSSVTTPDSYTQSGSDTPSSPSLSKSIVDGASAVINAGVTSSGGQSKSSLSDLASKSNTNAASSSSSSKSSNTTGKNGNYAVGGLSKTMFELVEDVGTPSVGSSKTSTSSNKSTTTKTTTTSLLGYENTLTGTRSSNNGATPGSGLSSVPGYNDPLYQGAKNAKREETGVSIGATQVSTSQGVDTMNGVEIHVEYGWASGGKPIPGRYMGFDGILTEYTLNFVGPSVELEVVGTYTDASVLVKSGKNSFSAKEYKGNPSKIVKAICDMEGIRYTKDSIVATENVKDSSNKKAYKTYLQNGRSIQSFIKSDLCADARTKDGKSAFVFYVDSDTNIAYFQPSSGAVSGKVKVKKSSETGSNKESSYTQGSSDSNFGTVVATYNYYTGQQNSEVISFSPTYTFFANTALASDTVAIDPDSNEFYRASVSGSVLSVKKGKDGIVRVGGNRMLGMSSATFKDLSRYSEQLWASLGAQSITASMEVLGDPSLYTGDCVWINVYTKYGIKHHTSGKYFIQNVEDSISDGSYITTLELQKWQMTTVSDESGFDTTGVNSANGDSSSAYDVLPGGSTLSASVKSPSAQDSTTPPNTNSDIITYASKFLGRPYVWGGNSLSNGCDCSHYTWNCLKDTGHFSGGYESSGGQRNWGVAVSPQQAQAGDLICYEGHVAFFVDSGHIIHARGKNYGIVVTQTDPFSYHNGYKALRRVL